MYMRANNELIIKKLSFIDFLIILCGLTAPIGERMNEYIPGVSKSFVFLGILLIILYSFKFIFVNSGRFKVIKDKTVILFLILFLFIFIHSTAEYVSRIYSMESVDVLNHYKINIFMVISYFILKSCEEKSDRMNYFILSFNISFLVTFIFFNEFTFANTVLRAEGAYLNANAFALDALFVLFTSIYLISQKKANKWVHLITLVSSGFALFLSGTRSTFLGLIIGLIFYFVNLKSTKKRLKILGVIILLGLVVLFNIPKDTIFLMINRLFEGDSELSSYGGNIRLLIWSDYIKSWNDYFIFGLDKELWNYINIKNTHNSYLYIMVKYGVFAIILYFLMIISFIRSSKVYVKVKSQENLIIISLLLALLVASIFIDALSLKTFWIIWTVCLYYNMKTRIQYHNSK